MINSGSATLDGTGQMSGLDGRPQMKPFWEVTPTDVKACLQATKWYPGLLEYFRGGGFSSGFRTQGDSTRTRLSLTASTHLLCPVPLTIFRINIVKGMVLCA